MDSVAIGLCFWLRWRSHQQQPQVILFFFIFDLIILGVMCVFPVFMIAFAPVFLSFACMFHEVVTLRRYC